MYKGPPAPRQKNQPKKIKRIVKNMKALKELELRQFLLLKYREKICLSNQMEDKFEIDVVDHYLW